MLRMILARLLNNPRKGLYRRLPPNRNFEGFRFCFFIMAYNEIDRLIPYSMDKDELSMVFHLMVAYGAPVESVIDALAKFRSVNAAISASVRRAVEDYARRCAEKENQDKNPQ